MNEENEFRRALWINAVETRLHERTPEVQGLWEKYARPHLGAEMTGAEWLWFLNMAATPLTEALWAMALEECLNQTFATKSIPGEIVRDVLPPPE